MIYWTEAQDFDPRSMTLTGQVQIFASVLQACKKIKHSMPLAVREGILNIFYRCYQAGLGSRYWEDGFGVWNMTVGTEVLEALNYVLLDGGRQDMVHRFVTHLNMD